MKVKEIGKIKTDGEEMFLQINEEYKAGIKDLDTFGHIHVLWWFDKCNNAQCRSIIEVNKPYKKAPDKMGVFATRSPQRPNPIALSVVQITHVDYEAGRIYIAYIDAIHDSIILDLKPYTPSLDRVENPKTPDWCSHWPISYEKSGEFNWEDEFLF